MRLSVEASLASHIAKRHNFQPGNDLRALVEKYADVEVLEFPVDTVDGISLYLKAPDRRPNILLNSNIPDTRRKFTLAHEFGHVIIPWHFGTVFSNIDKYKSSVDIAYREMEAEANRFAAELLMPAEWLNAAVLASNNPANVLKMVLDTCGTSMAAATIALNNALPPGYVYARLDEWGNVTASTSSPGTFAKAFAEGEKFEGSMRLRESSACYSMDFKGTHHWLYYDAEQVPELGVDDRPWREILDEIVSDTDAEAFQSNIKASVNAIISTCNKKGTSAQVFFASVRQRMAGRSDVYDAILEHPKFNMFLHKKVLELIARRT